MFRIILACKFREIKIINLVVLDLPRKNYHILLVQDINSFSFVQSTVELLIPKLDFMDRE